MNENQEIIAAPAVKFIELTTSIVAAYVSNNHVQGAELATLIAGTHAALAGLGQRAETEAPAVEKLTPAQIRKSITPDALISFIDGKPYKTLKRHLSRHGTTIEEYRERYGLPRDYPTTAASYSALRSEMAHKLGLGQQRKAAAKAAATAETVAEAPKKRRGRKKAA